MFAMQLRVNLLKLHSGSFKIWSLECDFGLGRNLDFEESVTIISIWKIFNAFESDDTRCRLLGGTYLLVKNEDFSFKFSLSAVLFTRSNCFMFLKRSVLYLLRRNVEMKYF